MVKGCHGMPQTVAQRAHALNCISFSIDSVRAQNQTHLPPTPACPRLLRMALGGQRCHGVFGSCNRLTNVPCRHPQALLMVESLRSDRFDVLLFVNSACWPADSQACQLQYSGLAGREGSRDGGAVHATVAAAGPQRCWHWRRNETGGAGGTAPACVHSARPCEPDQHSLLQQVWPLGPLWVRRPSESLAASS